MKQATFFFGLRSSFSPFSCSSGRLSTFLSRLVGPSQLRPNFFFLCKFESVSFLRFCGCVRPRFEPCSDFIGFRLLEVPLLDCSLTPSLPESLLSAVAVC